MRIWHQPTPRQQCSCTHGADPLCALTHTHTHTHTHTQLPSHSNAPPTCVPMLSLLDCPAAMVPITGPTNIMAAKMYDLVRP